MGLFELIYYLGYRTKRFFSLRGQKSLPGKVISVGNITVGGTGKTPAVIAIAKEAMRRGFTPCILTRGYRGKMKGPCFVSTGEGPLLTARYAGDEPTLMAWKLNGVPIVKSANRYEAGMFALKELPALRAEPLFILDDGYQHWRLKRDVDILLVDSQNPFGSGKLLPVGTLREPIYEMRRAHIIVLTKTEGAVAEPLIAEIRKYNKEAMLFTSRHEFSGMTNAFGEEMSLELFKDADAYAFCGIGDPESFVRTLKDAGIRLKGLKTYRDHYNYKAADLSAIMNSARRLGAKWIITTEKDIIRLKDTVEALPDNLAVACIEFSAEENFFDEIMKRL